MKTKNEIIKEVTDVDIKPDMNILSDPQDIYDCMDKWSDQEKQALKDRIIKLCRQAVADETMSTSTFASILDQFLNFKVK